MPKLGTDKVKKVFLPSTENEPNEEDRAWVVVKEKLLLRDLVALSDGANDTENALNGLASYIKDWNFTKDDGTKEDINAESVGRLEAVDFNFLAGEMKAVTDSVKGALSIEEKKDSTSTSTLNIPVVNQT